MFKNPKKVPELEKKIYEKFKINKQNRNPRYNSTLNKPQISVISPRLSLPEIFTRKVINISIHENIRPLKYKASSMISNASSRNNVNLLKQQYPSGYSRNNSVGSDLPVEKSFIEPSLEPTREVHHMSAPKIDI
jgi:hypothetical protein